MILDRIVKPDSAFHDGQDVMETLTTEHPSYTTMKNMIHGFMILSVTMSWNELSR